ncbi:MAG: nucleotidyltransferase domain-containing protein [Kineosporiaceae bacterium]
MAPRPPQLDRIGDVAARHPGLGLLLLLGSRATGTAREHSDWDFGVLADPDHAVDLARLAADLMALVGSDDVDVVDLARASAVLRRDAASVGVVLVERQAGAFLGFALEAVTFWCDVEPVLRRAHAEVLRSVTA